MHQRACHGSIIMSGVRVLVGTRKGAFILTSDGHRQKWDVTGPHFGGWEIYHMKGSPVDPNRIYASQSSGWFGQVIQRSSDGGLDVGAGRQSIRLRRRPRHASVVRRDAPSVGVQASLASGAVARRSQTWSTPAPIDPVPHCRRRRTVHDRRRHRGGLIYFSARFAGDRFYSNVLRDRAAGLVA